MPHHIGEGQETKPGVRTGVMADRESATAPQEIHLWVTENGEALPPLSSTTDLPPHSRSIPRTSRESPTINPQGPLGRTERGVGEGLWALTREGPGTAAA